jgi:hypothetical protein
MWSTTLPTTLEQQVKAKQCLSEGSPNPAHTHHMVYPSNYGYLSSLALAKLQSILDLMTPQVLKAP